MQRILAAAWLACATALASLAGGLHFTESVGVHRVAERWSETKLSSEVVTRERGLSVGLAFEPTAGQTGGKIQFVARGEGMLVGLGNEGIAVKVAGIRDSRERAERTIRIEFEQGGKTAKELQWRAAKKFTGETNYLIGRDRAKWRRHVPRYARAEAKIFPGVRAAAYGPRGELEYDLRVSAGAPVASLGMRIEGAKNLRVDTIGNLWMQVAGRSVEIRKPEIYVEGQGKTRKQGSQEKLERRIAGGYVLRGNGRIGFWLGPHDAGTVVVIDPTLTLTYTTFLGGPGGTAANSVAVDAQGDLYVAGETAATGSFPGTDAQSVGPAGASSYLFVAKINPGVVGASSLDWLTFIGGSGSQAGGAIAVDASGNVAIAGSTTSVDYPVTDGSAMKMGANSAVVTEIDQATGTSINFSTMLGGNGAEWNENAGGVAIDASGRIYVASDTTSADLCTGAATAAPFQATYGGGTSDGFLAMYQPGGTPSLRYCTYLGIFAEVGVTGLALDSKENAYLAGFISQPINPTEFPSTTNGFQANYGGGDYDGFVVKISPSGNGASDLSYATYLGGTGSDKIKGIAVDSSQFPATVYVTGATDSTDFPMGAISAYQAKQNAGLGGTNAFLAVVTQSGSEMTTLEYVTYLGGSSSDQGSSLAELAPNAVYVAGSASSTDFPWLGNLQPLSADTDAFVAEVDTTVPGSSGLKFATPLGGTPGTGLTGTTAASGVAASISADGSGNVEVFVAGSTDTSDFPQAPGAEGTGVELTCASCPGAADGFAIEIAENPTGAAGASVEFDPAVVRFKASGATTPVNVGIKNTGDMELRISSVSLSQVGSDFSLQPASPCANQVLAPQSTDLCSFAVLFTGSSAMSEGATILVTDNASGGAQVLQVAGVSGVPEGTVVPASLNFGSVAIGTTNGPLYVTLANTGGLPLNVTQISISSEDFLEVATGGAGVGAGCSTIPAGMSCLLGVEFKPTAAGTVNATLTFTDNSGSEAEAVQTVTLMGTGDNGGPTAAVEPAALAFGSEPLGTTSGAQSVTLTNTGSAALNVSSISISGGNAGFAMTASGQNSCPVGGGTVAPEASCSVSLTFLPQTAGTVGGSLNFFDNAGNGEQSVALSGTGAGTIAASVAPTSISFAGESVGTKSTATNVTVTNTGSAALEITSVGVTGADPNDFSEATNCSGSLAAGKACLVQVTFAPTAGGIRTATLSVVDNAAESPQTVPLSGTGTQAAVTISPASVNFSPAQLAGTPSVTQTVTLNSTGTGALAVSRISFPGADGNDFTETDNCSGAGGVTIPAGQSCAIHIVFKPLVQDTQCGTTAGERCATLTLADNAPNSPQTVTLTGTTMDFEIEPTTGGSLAQTVTAGGTATYSLEIDSIGGFAGRVALACSEPAAITGTSCSVSTGSVTVSANTATAFTVSVPTTGASTTTASSAARQGDRHGGQWKNGLNSGVGNTTWGFIAGICVLAMLTARRHMRFAEAALVIACTILCGSCGGGGNTTTTADPTVTPSGTYANAITITATTGAGSSEATRTAQLTLVVQ